MTSPASGHPKTPTKRVLRLQELEDREVPSSTPFAVQFGPTNDDNGKAVATDAAGNIFTTGTYDAARSTFINKYDPSGNLIWSSRPTGTGVFGTGIIGTGIATDGAGNVYVTGYFNGTADFGGLPLTGLGNRDGYVTKLDPAGNFLWARQFGGTGSTVTVDGLAADAAGNLVFAGNFAGTADFNPGPGEDTLTSVGNVDVVVGKLDMAGNFVWAKRFGGANTDVATSVALDGDGNVLSTGYFFGTVDFDPGPGSVDLTSTSADSFVSKLDAAGDYVWAKRFGGIPGSNVSSSAVTTDNDGNVITTGTFIGTVDFNPAVAAANLSSVGSLYDSFVSKLDPAGNHIWAKRFGGTAGGDGGNGVTTDDAGNVITTGHFYGAVDFDPGAGTFNLTAPATFAGTYVSKLNAAGNFVSAKQFTGSGIVFGNAVTTDSQQNIIVTGLFRNTADFDPGAGTFNLTAYESDQFLVKLLPSTIAGVAWVDQDADHVRDAGEPPAAGIIVELFDQAGLSLQTQLTNEAGAYEFMVSPDATGYRMQFRPPTGFNFVTPDQGGDDTTDSDADAAGNTAVTPVALDEIVTQDVGLTGVTAAFGFAAKVGGSGTDEGHAIARDTEGNVYVTGSFSGTAEFGAAANSYQLTSAGGLDVYVAKYSPGGALVWARRFGGPQDDEGFGISFVNTSAYVTKALFVTGYFGGAADFDPSGATSNLLSAGGHDAFVCRVDLAGKLVWARGFGGPEDDSGLAIVSDEFGGVFTTGRYADAADFDPGPDTRLLTSDSGGDAGFISKLYHDGSFAFARAMTGTGPVVGTDIALDSQGNIIVSGTFSGAADFDPTDFAYLVTSNADSSDGFVAKYNFGGGLFWAVPLGGPEEDHAVSLWPIGQSHIYVAGSFRGTADFDPSGGQTNLTSAGGEDVFVAKLAHNGVLTWARRLGGAGDDTAHGLATDGQGSPLVTGSFAGTADFDPGPGFANLVSLSGTPDVFLSELDAEGNYRLARRLGGAGTDAGLAILSDGDNGLLTVGRFSGTADFDPAGPSFSLTAGGGADGFVSKLTKAFVTGVAWDDRDADGVRDPGEPTVAGAVVELLDSSGASVGIRVTGTDGAYSFTASPDVTGGYTVQFRPPSGLGFTTQDQGGDDSKDSDVIQNTGRTPSFPLTGDQTAVMDAGLTGTAPAFGFAVSAGVNGTTDSRGMVTDASGNVYVTGALGTADFDPGAGNYPLTGAGDGDAYVAKYTPVGALVWARRLGGALYDGGSGVAVDGAGNVHVTGHFFGTADFDPDPNGAFTLTSAGDSDAFVAKLDADGRFIWAKRIGGTRDDRSLGIALDGSGNVLTTGYFSGGGADFNPDPVATHIVPFHGLNEPDAYVSKLDANGNFVWAKGFGGGFNDQGLGVAVDAAGNVLATGIFVGTADFNPDPAVTFNLTTPGGHDAFVTKLDATGNFLWAGRFGGIGDDSATRVATDPTGNVLVGGYFGNTADFNPDPTVTSNLTSAGDDDAFVAKLDTDGHLVWARQFGGTGRDAGRGVASDALGNVYLVGNFSGSVIVDFGFSTQTVSSAGNFEAFVTKLDAAGRFVLVRQFGGPFDEQATAVTADGDGNVHTTGSFSGTADFDPGSNSSYPLSGGSGAAMFVSKLALTDVTGLVWNDLNGDGLRDVGEPGFADARVELFNAVDGVAGNTDDVLLESVAAGADGSYRFRDATRGGNRYVRINPPAGTGGSPVAYAEVTQPGGDSDVDRQGRSGLFDLLANPIQTLVGGLRTIDAPAPAWAIGSTGADAVRDVTTDEAGNTYVVGSFGGASADLDPGPGEVILTNDGDSDGYVVKYDPAGLLLWARRMGGAGSGNALQATGVAVDANGNVIVTGTFAGAASFGSLPLQCVGGTDAFVTKLDANGTFLWARQVESTGDVAGVGVAVDAANNIHATGTFTDDINYEGTILANPGGTDSFVLRLNTNGGTPLIRQLGGAGNAEVTGIAVNISGVYLSGSFTGTIDFNPVAGAGGEFPLNSVGGSSDAFVVRLGLGNTFSWAKQIGGGDSDTARGVALDANGNVLFAGGYQGTVNFNPSGNPINLTSTNDTSDAYVGKLNKDGDFVWAKSVGGTSPDEAVAVATDSRGYVFVTGEFGGQADLNPDEPNPFYNAVFNLTSDGGTDVFVVKLKEDGQFVLADRLGGIGADSPTAITARGEGDVFVVGTFAGTADLDFALTPYLMTAAGTDGFVAKSQEFVIEGRVWQDLNGNGILNAGEPSLTDGLAELYDSVDGLIGNGDDALVTLVGLTEGQYRFADMRDGPGYYVRVALNDVRSSGNSLPMYLASPPGQGFNPLLDSNVDDDGKTSLVRRWQGPTVNLGAGFRERPLVAGGWGAGQFGSEVGRAVTTDAAGNVYTVGTFEGVVDFDPRSATVNLTSAGVTDGFVTKHDASGHLLWARRLGGTARDEAAAVAIDATGNVLVTGTFEGSATFGVGSPTLAAKPSGTSVPGRDVFVWKLTAAGDYAWVRQLGGVKAESAAAIATDPAGNVLTLGTFEGTADFDPAAKVVNLVSTPKTTPANTPSRDAFISKLNKDGVFVWARKVGGSEEEIPAGIATDAQGRVYFNGNFSLDTDYDPGPGVVGLFIGLAACQYDAAGNLGWAKYFTLTSMSGIAVAGDYLYLTGSAIWKLKLDGSDVWTTNWLGDINHRAIAIDGLGNVLTTGSFSTAWDFRPGEGTFILQPVTPGEPDAFVSKFDANGNFLSAYSLAGFGPDSGFDIAVGSGGVAFVTGSFQGNADFDITSDVQQIHSSGTGTDAFVWKIPAGGVTGHMWHDTDGDGLRDLSEPDVSGAVITLYRSVNAVIGDSDDVPVGSQVTAPDGSYRFVAPAPGAGYYVRVQPPVVPGIAYTTQDRPGNESIDSDVNTQGISGLFTADAAIPVSLDIGTAGIYPPFGFGWTTVGPGESKVLASATDAAGNVYVTGEFKGTVDFDPGTGATTLVSTGISKNGFVAKYTSAGNLYWVRRFGGPDDIGGQGIAVDETGGVYVTGRFKGSAEFGAGSPTLFASGYDAFVAKLDTSGGFAWARSVSGNSDDFGNGITVGNGRVIVTGSFKGSAFFDPIGADMLTLTSYGSQDAFVLALNATTGNRVWARQVGGAGGDDVGRGVTTDAAGGVFVAGSFSGTADFDPGTVVLDQTSVGLRDAFVWKLDKDGNVAWASHAGGTDNDDATALALDSAGRVAVTGAIAGTADFDPGAGLLEVLSNGATDAFVWQLSPAGVPVWARGLGGPAIDAGHDIAADGTGVYVTGAFQQTADFDPGAGRINLVSNGGTDAFLAKLDTEGNRQWARRLGGSNDDAGQGVAVDATGRVTFAGGIYGQGTFDPADGNQLMAGGPVGNFFVARVDQTPAGGAFPLDSFEPNNETAVATNLGVVNVQQVIEGLSLSSAQDKDVFRFDLLRQGQTGHKIRIEVTPGNGNVVLALHRAGQAVPLTSVTITDGQATAGEISLNGRLPDAYEIRVSGSANPGYSLTIDAPAGYSPDAAEPNGEDSQATDLGILTAPADLSRLSINTPGDIDWFAFDTLADGSLASEVRLDFRNAQGDIDLDLCDADGNVIRSSAGAGDSESVSLAGLPAGRYLVRVSGHIDAINPAYKLTVRPPRPLEVDEKEPNNIPGTAANLGELQGDTVWEGLSIHSGSDADWFKFVTVATGSTGHAVSVDFAHAEGDLDLLLFDETGVNQLAASTGNADSESVSLQGRPAGTYYVKVSGFAGATQPSYRLRVSAPVGETPTDRLEGTAGNQTRQTASVIQTPGKTKLEGVQSLVDLTLHTTTDRTDEDWFKFTTVGKGTAQHRLVLNHPAANGVLGLELYNAAGKKIVTGAGANGSLVASLKGLAAGTYYARTFIPKGGSLGSGYSLTFDPPTSAAPVTPDDWTIMVYMTADSLTERAFNDVNEMEAAVAGLPGSVNFAVMWDQSANLKTYPTGNGSQKAWGTVGRALIAPDTNPDTVATKFEILPEKNTGNAAALKEFVAWAKQAAPANHYALVFWDHGGGLRGFNFDTQDGQPTGSLTPDEVVVALAGQPKLDLIAFDACFMGVAETAHALRDVTNVVVGSQDAIPGDGFEYDRAFSVLAATPGDVTADALATGLVQAFAERYGTTGNGDTLSAVKSAELPALATALRGVSDALLAATDEERRRVVAIAASTLLPNRATPEQRDLGGFLAAMASDGTLSSGLHTAAATAILALDSAVISRTADLRSHSGLSVYLPVVDVELLTIDPLLISDYATRYPGFVSATAWPAMLAELRASVDEPRPNNTDSDEQPVSNDAQGTATDLRLLGATGIVKSGLSLHNLDDTDWYKFQVASEVGATLEVEVVVRTPDVTLIAELRSAANQLLATAVNGRLRLENLPGGTQTYYLTFYSNTEVGNYGFTINPPVSEADRSGDNSTPDKTYVLESQAGGAYSGFSVAANSQDWLRFDTTAQTTTDLRRATLSVSGGNSVQAQLRNAAGYVVSSASGTGSLVLPYTLSGAAESYTLVIVNPNPVAVGYGLRLETATTADGGHPLDRFSRTASLAASSDWSVNGTIDVDGSRAVVGSATGRALWKNHTATDVGAQVRFQLPTTGRPTVSVLARATEAGVKLMTGYEARLELFKGALTAKLYRYVNGVSSLMAFAAGPKVSEGVLRLEVQGVFLRVLVNGNQCLEFTDTLTVPVGRTGFAGVKNAVIDDFQSNVIATPLPMGYAVATNGLGPAWRALTGQFSVQDTRFVSGNAAASAVYTPARLADVAVTAGYSLSAAGQYVGLIARDNGAVKRSYYEAQVSRTAANTFVTKLTRYVNGAAKALATITTGVPQNGVLRLEALGNEIRLLIDGNALATVRDSAIPLPGRAGITAAGSMTLTGLRVTALAPRFADEFNRPDNTSLGSSWDESGGNLKIAGNRLVGDADDRAIVRNLSLTNVSLSAFVDLSSTGQRTVGLIARDTGSSYYEGRLTRAATGKLTAVIYLVTNGTEKALKTLTFSKATSGVLRFDVEGSTLKLSLYGESLSVTNTTLSGSGGTGLHLGALDTADDFRVR